MAELTKWVLMLFLVVYGSCLRLSQDPVPEYYSPQQYQLELADIQQKLDEEMNQLNKQISSINELIQDKKMATKTKIVKLSQSIADQRTQLYDIQQFLELPYKLKICQCKTLTEAQIAGIEDKISKIEAQMGTLQQKVGSCEASGTCSKTEQLKTSIKNMKLYLTSLRGIVNSECCKNRIKFEPEQATGFVNLNQTLTKDNLKAKNWYYGATSESQYRYKMFEMSTKFNVSSCPLERPYANGKRDECFQCEKPDQMFNLGDRKCYSCQKDQYLNETTSECQKCLPLAHYNSTLKKCQECSAAKVWNDTSKKCESCDEESGQHFNSDTKKCEKCPASQEYDILSKQCMKCQQNEQFNNQTFKCQSCPDGQYFDNITKTCKRCKGRKYYSDTEKKCVRCPKDTQLNLKTLQCESCKAGQHYNSTIGICSTCQENLTYDAVSKKCQSESVLNECPSDYPYYNSYEQKCESCRVGFVFDWELLECKRGNNIGICPQNKVYNYEGHKCQECPQGQIYNKYFNECETKGENVSNS